MAHPEQRNYCLSVKQKFPNYFSKKKVLDVGSLDINGCNKPLFESCEYLGIDIGVGPNVDLVCKGHELDYADEYFDTIVSTECFEHDMHFTETLKNIVRMLKPEGLFFFTCGGDGRGEHGTLRTDTFSSPLTTRHSPNWANYYRNVNESWFRDIIVPEDHFENFKFSYLAATQDFQFYGIKHK